MFFKMLKSDLKRKKGLNVILFIFITVASVLVFAGAVEIFSTITVKSTTDRYCNASDATLIMMPYKSYISKPLVDTEKKLDDDPNVISWDKEQWTRISYTSMDYPDIDEKNDNISFVKDRQNYICKLPRVHDLVYDMNDQPFYVESGKVAIPVEMSRNLGVSIGDKIKFTTLMGDVYELEVSKLFKENGYKFLVRFIVADADYDILTKDEIRKYPVYGLKMKESSIPVLEELQKNITDENAYPLMLPKQDDTSDDDYVMRAIISVFVVIICIFLILIIFMTIRFTMVAELKNEEKEIGMMKALGVDSLKFRWIFAAKYIAFAIVGGIIGIAVGLPLSGMVVNIFDANAILPKRSQMIIIGIISVLLMIFMMIAFSLFVMRRISKISVIDAIHGENHGERFGKGSPMFLHKRKKMSVSMFLALSDLLGRAKRYIFLVIAYTLGAAIMLLAFNVRNSIVSTEFAKFFLYHTLDFGENLYDDVKTRMKAEGVTFTVACNEMFEEAGFPAHFDSEFTTDGYYINEGGEKEKFFYVLFGDAKIEKLRYREGGKCPQLENEAAMSYFTAKKYGINVGDVLKFIIYEKNDSNTDYVENERQIVITAFFDYFEGGTPALIMGKDYDKGYHFGENIIGQEIDAKESEKAGIIKEMKAYFGEDKILDTDELIKDWMSEYDRLFALIEYVLGGAIIAVLLLITYLYSSVFIAEETSEIALLKSTGFTSGAVKKWQILRILMLAAVSIVIAEVLFRTLGKFIMTKFMENYSVTGTTFLFEFPVSFILIPLIITVSVLTVVALTLRGVRNIAIWKISEE